jgi:hypothetical protein
MAELWSVATALGRGEENDSSSSSHWSFQETQSIPLQLHLYSCTSEPVIAIIYQALEQAIRHMQATGIIRVGEHQQQAST